VKRRSSAIALVLLCACSAATWSRPGTPTASTSAAASDGSSGPRTPGETVVVTRTVDGDTIHVLFRGHDVDVRLIGIDTPETVDPSLPVQCYGEQASRFTHRTLTGRTVRLEFDVERLDRYSRTLAYIWLRGHLFNRRLVAGGYAVVDTFPPNVRYVDVFTAAQRVAREHDRGLWGACSGSDGGGGHRCDPAYPGVCIPSPPRDLDCADISFRHFQVLPPDPHNFDGDHNGIGCET
jgi:micrococcal nuclease